MINDDELHSYYLIPSFTSSIAKAHNILKEINLPCTFPRCVWTQRLFPHREQHLHKSILLILLFFKQMGHRLVQ